MYYRVWLKCRMYPIISTTNTHSSKISKTWTFITFHIKGLCQETFFITITNTNLPEILLFANKMPIFAILVGKKVVCKNFLVSEENKPLKLIEIHGIKCIRYWNRRQKFSMHPKMRIEIKWAFVFHIAGGGD